ncbi:hypothetical protein NL676_011698 [Syzygium grande]|nr:hypothetical protein NL676_011698 [Syzygium grande]
MDRPFLCPCPCPPSSSSCSCSASIKYSEHRTVSSKLAGESWSTATMSRTVRISFADEDATDSSSDEEEGRGPASRFRVKKYVSEIRIEDDSVSRPGSGAASGERRVGNGKARPKVKQQQQQQQAAPKGGGRRYRGGPDAQTNFARPVIDIDAAAVPDSAEGSGKVVRNQSLSSPTSVLRFQTSEEAEPESKVGDRRDWPLAQQVPEDEGCLLDPVFLRGFFDPESPGPVFLEEMSGADAISKDDFDQVCFEFLEEDLGSCKWDVDNYFQDPLVLH